MEATSVGRFRTRTTYNLKSQTTKTTKATTTSVVVLSDSDSEPDSRKDRRGKSLRSNTAFKGRPRSSHSAPQSPAARRRLRGSRRVPLASSASTAAAARTSKHEYIRSARSSFMRLRKRPLRALRTQSAKATRRPIRPNRPIRPTRPVPLRAGHNRFAAQRTALRSTRTRKADEPEMEVSDQLPPEKLAGASSEQNGSQLILSIAQFRALAADVLFASVPNPSSVLFVHSLLQPGADKLTLEQVWF